MSIKTQKEELIKIAHEVAKERNLNIQELVNNNQEKQINEIWTEAVKRFDANKQGREEYVCK